MSARGRRGMVLAGLLLAASGCDSLRAPLRPLVSAPADFAAYRETRVAETLDGRLAAAEAYIERFPDGAYAAETRAWFKQSEPVFFEARRGSLTGLEGYLRALPHGPHAREALALLRAQQESRESPDEAGRQASATEMRLARASARRVAARDGVAAWVGRFLDPAAWRGRIADAPAELVVPWSLGLPAPACRPAGGVEDGASRRRARISPAASGRRCTKMIELEYPVLVGAVVEPRQITLQIDVDEDVDGRLQAVTLAGPELFLRLEETFTVRALASNDGSRRIDAIVRQVDALRGAFERRVAKGSSLPPECKRHPVAPTILELECGGLSMVVTAGEGASDDVIAIRRQEP